ncbi:MAG: radical SAM protein [Candidatus Omnitrophica bacterium]|nr:radical SAM protein [Candidatus Omnitrophota bacterium]
MVFKNRADRRRILLINPPNDLGMGEGSFNAVIDIYQPLGLAYIAAVLERAGYEVRVVDSKVENLSNSEIIRRILEFRPFIVGLTSSTPDFSSARSLAGQIKASGDYIILIGGRHVSALPEETMQEGCFDYGIIGEGENTVVELAQAISTGNLQQLPQIKGIVFRDGSKILCTPPREYIQDLDTLPFPARHLFPPLSKYTYLYYKSLPLATIITSRGCPYQCTFCDRAVFGNRVRMRSINNILDEIEMLVKDYGVRSINIPDDLFTLPSERLEEFCRQLLSRKLKISWSCFSRVDSVTPQILKIMKQAGCWMIGYGIESGNEKSLEAIKKDAGIEKAKKALEATRRVGIRSLGFFILGLPGEEEEDVLNTLTFANKLPLDRVVFFMTQPFPGSEMYRMLLSQGRLNRGVDYRYYHNFCFPGKLSFVTEGLTVDILEKYRKKAYRDFYLRPGYIFRQFLNNPEIANLPTRVKAFLKAVW